MSRRLTIADDFAGHANQLELPNLWNNEESGERECFETRKGREVGGGGVMEATPE